MTIRIGCQDLGVQDCDWVVTGETAADVVREVVGRLRDEKGIDLPDPEVILEGDPGYDPLGERMDAAGEMIVRRLREELDLGGYRGPDDAAPVVGRLLDR